MAPRILLCLNHAGISRRGFLSAFLISQAKGKQKKTRNKINQAPDTAPAGGHTTGRGAERLRGERLAGGGVGRRARQGAGAAEAPVRGGEGGAGGGAGGAVRPAVGVLPRLWRGHTWQGGSW